MEKITSFVILICCIVIIFSAGCTDTANEGAVTSTTIPTSPLQKYSTGDIVVKDSSSSSGIVIQKYDNIADTYDVFDVSRSASGSWSSQASSSTRTLSRTVVEKLYLVKIETGVSTRITTMTTKKPNGSETSQQLTPTSSSSKTISTTTVIPTKDQDAIHKSVATATRSINVNGDISANYNANKNIIGYVSIPLVLQDSGMTVDMSKLTVSFRYLNGEVSDDAIAAIHPEATKSANSGEVFENNLGAISTTTNIMNSPNWGIINKNNANSDEILESGEIFTIVIGIPTTVSPVDHFVVDIKPATGSALSLDIKTPSSSGSSNKLEYSYL